MVPTHGDGPTPPEVTSLLEDHTLRPPAAGRGARRGGSRGAAAERRAGGLRRRRRAGSWPPSAPIPAVAGARARPRRVRRRRCGAGAPSSGWTSLLVPEADGGGCLTEHGLIDLVLVAEEMGRVVAPGPLGPVNVVADALGRARHAPRSVPSVLPGLLDGTAVAAWCGPDAGRRHDADGDGVTLERHGRRPVEAGAQADHLLVTVAGRRRARARLLVARRRSRAHRRAARTAWTWSDGSPGCTSTSVVLVERRHRRRRCRRGRGDVERQLQMACVLQCAETVGALDHVFAMTARVPRRPLLVRPAAVVLPGAQAPRRRTTRCGWRPATPSRPRPPARSPSGAPTPPSVVSAAKALDRPARHRADPGLRPAARRHRRHLGARPAPVPASGHGRTGPRTARPRSTPSASPPRSWRQRRERRTRTGPDLEPVEDFRPGPERGWPTTCHRSATAGNDRSDARRARGARPAGARSGTAASPGSASPPSTADSASPPSTSGRSPPSPRPTTCRSR